MGTHLPNLKLIGTRKGTNAKDERAEFEETQFGEEVGLLELLLLQV